MAIVITITNPPCRASMLGCSLIINHTQIGPIWVWLIIKEQPSIEALQGGLVIVITIAIHSFLKLRKS